jgi:hypothetical protein
MLTLVENLVSERDFREPVNTKGARDFLNFMVTPAQFAKTSFTEEYRQKISQNFFIDSSGIIRLFINRQGRI